MWSRTRSADSVRSDPKASRNAVVAAFRLADVMPAPRSKMPAPPDGLFRTIVVDPLWPFRNIASHGAAANHFPWMSIGELPELPFRLPTMPISIFGCRTRSSTRALTVMIARHGWWELEQRAADPCASRCHGGGQSESAVSLGLDLDRRGELVPLLPEVF
jgi:hypothetical protein